MLQLERFVPVYRSAHPLSIPIDSCTVNCRSWSFCWQYLAEQSGRVCLCHRISAPALLPSTLRIPPPRVDCQRHAYRHTGIPAKPNQPACSMSLHHPRRRCRSPSEIQREKVVDDQTAHWLFPVPRPWLPLAGSVCGLSRSQVVSSETFVCERCGHRTRLATSKRHWCPNCASKQETEMLPVRSKPIFGLAAVKERQ